MVESDCIRGGAGNVAESAYRSRAADRSPGSDPGRTPVPDAGCNRIASADYHDVRDLAAKSGGHV